MNRTLTKRLALDYLKVYRISALIWNGALLSLIVFYIVWALWADWTLIPAWGAMGLLVVSLVLFVWVIPSVKYARFRYELFEEELEIQSGIIFITNVLVPMSRVQHVEVESGPLMRRYNLASVSVVTAATTHTIQGLTSDDADGLKRRIGMLARVEESHE